MSTDMGLYFKSIFCWCRQQLNLKRITFEENSKNSSEDEYGQKIIQGKELEKNYLEKQKE